MRVLIVEPDRAYAEKFAHIIQKIFNAEITIVSTSYEASAYIRSVLFDLLLVEVNLPDLRGDLIVGFAPEGFKLGMSASHTSPEIRSQFDEFLLKPFVEDELIRILTNMQFQYLHSINHFSFIA